MVNKEIIKIVSGPVIVQDGKLLVDKEDKDYHETINSDEKTRIDVFYGDKKMFITINCSQEDRLRFNEELFKITEMPKPKKIKPLKGKF